ncbi:Cys/Met metabolism PLP-dependent enzyme-domain-containing protein [Phakopsora pachyrhizi]|nr:Cys/Met metabolism PLP-dependent enzyme-domain-containing protein [Phakopsora pachyrhizi]
MSELRKPSPGLSPLNQSPLTRAIHGSDEYDHLSRFLPVASDISVSTNFRFQPPSDLLDIRRRLGDFPSRSLSNNPVDRRSDVIGSISNSPAHSIRSSGQEIGSRVDPPNLYSYKRYSHPTLARTEKVLSTILNGEALVYSSGLSAAFAALMAVNPDVIAIRDGYMGCHETIKKYCKLRGMGSRSSVEVRVIDLDDSYPPIETGLKVLVWLETPVNPTGECRDIRAYARKVRECSVGSELLVDATLSPPPLARPMNWADITLYSGTKYFGGHSDLLCGILVVQKTNQTRWQRLWEDRTYLGMIPGSLESWLMLRSIKTLQIRVIHQSDTATRLANWLNSLTERDYLSESDPDEKRRLVTRVWHSSFQDGGRWVGFDPKTKEPRQMVGGGSPCFAFMLERPIYSKWLPYCTEIFVPATSLGGVESLIQQQYQSDPKADPRIVRLSIGLEDYDDLRNDLIKAFDKVIRYERHSKL